MVKLLKNKSSCFRNILYSKNAYFLLNLNGYHRMITASIMFTNGKIVGHVTIWKSNQINCNIRFLKQTWFNFGWLKNIFKMTVDDNWMDLIWIGVHQRWIKYVLVWVSNAILKRLKDYTVSVVIKEVERGKREELKYSQFTFKDHINCNKFTISNNVLLC